MHGPDLNKISGDKTPCLYVLRFVKNKIAHRDIYVALSSELCEHLQFPMFNIFSEICSNLFFNIVTWISLFIHHNHSVNSPSLQWRLFTQMFIQGADQRKHQSSESLAFVRRIHRWPVNSPHKGPATAKMFPFDDVIMIINVYGYQRQSVLWAGQIITHVHFIRQLSMSIFGNLIYELWVRN